jgi:hypothetical protein
MNPLNYWRNNTIKYPILSIITRRYLTIPTTSASIKRIFSISSNIIIKKRNKL